MDEPCGYPEVHKPHVHEGGECHGKGIYTDDDVVPKPLYKFCGHSRPHTEHIFPHGGKEFTCTGPPGQDGDSTAREKAEYFLRECGLEPTPDAIGQLTEVFLPCLRIMIERGYEPDGSTWRAEGARGMIWKAMDKMERLWFHSWKHGHLHDDSVYDGINYLGFYWRTRSQDGDGWGKRGAPGYD